MRLRSDEPGASILDNLNDVQRQGVIHGDGPLLILAGAGSGKTRVLTRRLAHLVAVRGVPPERILAVTFTNKAAGEMRERVGRLLGSVASSMWIGTFHSICLRILRRHQHRLGFRGTMTVFDAEDALAVIREVLKESGIGESGLRPRDAQSTISMAKNQLLDPGTFEEASPGPARQRIAQVWRLYEERLRSQDGVDFDDLLLLALRLLAEDRVVGDEYAERFRHVLVDEYQDTNRVQFYLVRRLAERHGNICVVGDDDQSIYGWRGADITNILEFERHFHGAAILRMEQNYRSTTSILEVANAIARHNRDRKEKSLWTANDRGEPVRLYLAEEEEEEARYVGRRIREALRQGTPCRGIAILYRTHAQSRPIEDALLRAEVPYRVVGGVSFYQRREVKDLLAYLRLLVNPLDEVSFRRAALAPRRGAGETTLDRLIAEGRARGVDPLAACEQAEAWGIAGRGLPALSEMAGFLRALSQRTGEPPHVLLEEIVGRVGYRDWLRTQGDGDWEDRYAHVLELIEGARSYEGSEEGSTLAGFLEQVTLYAQVDSLSDAQERVTLMTVHNAKGLEFDSVFVTGLEEGLFPHVSALSDPQEMEEERRLFYVAATRACRHLTLTASRSRRQINWTGLGDLSRFLSEIPNELLSLEGGMALGRPGRGPVFPPSVRVAARTAPRSGGDAWEEPSIERESATPRRPKGLMAKHVRYGMGEVVSIDGEGDAARVEVLFPGWGTKKILRAYLTLVEKG
jgi:DNA helicase II / ATP-dependent DNA helicase PcrA